MLQIREEQMRAFERAKFERWLVDHVHQFYPDSCRRLGPGAALECVRQGLQDASEHGFSDDTLAAQFVDLCFLFGIRFVTGGEFPWASQVLRDPSLVDPAEKMDRLFSAALAHLKANARP